MKLEIALVSFLTGAAVLATGQSMAAAFYLTQVGTPLSIGTVGVANTVNNYGADAAWAQPAGMVDLKEDTVNVTGLTLLYPEMKFDSSVAEAGGGDGGNAGEAALIPSHFTVKKLSDRTSVGIAITEPRRSPCRAWVSHRPLVTGSMTSWPSVRVSPSPTRFLKRTWPSTSQAQHLMARSKWRTWMTGAISRSWD